MGLVVRLVVCWPFGHDWRVVRKDRNVIVRQCYVCDKMQVFNLRKEAAR